MEIHENKPATLAECFRFLEDHLDKKLIEEVSRMPYAETWQLHFSLSPIIQKDIIHGNDTLNSRLEKSAFCDDPNISDQIAVAFWDYLQMRED